MLQKLLPLLAAMLMPLAMHGQSIETALAKLQDKWTLDADNNARIVRVVDAPGISKDTLYQRAYHYFLRHYVSGRSVLQVHDQALGCIIATGLYDRVHVSILGNRTAHTLHTLRVDVKEGRARITVVLTHYYKDAHDDLNEGYSEYVPIAWAYPINAYGNERGLMARIFHESVMRATATTLAVKAALTDSADVYRRDFVDW